MDRSRGGGGSGLCSGNCEGCYLGIFDVSFRCLRGAFGFVGSLKSGVSVLRLPARAPQVFC